MVLNQMNFSLIQGITLEKIKTMNYNMGQAFGRLDQLLRQIETKINKDE
jgi:hypothetical protein